jgi:NAD(P)-dependent dehydrogenase (short-subunit alcohol dehydrogenase family)
MTRSPSYKIAHCQGGSGLVKPGIAGQTAIVTGAARGIGLGIARRLAEDGCKVVLWDRDPSPLDAAGDVAPALVRTVDVTSLEAVEQAFAATRAAIGDVQILVNNAGINGPVAKTWDYPPDAWARVLAVNLTGVFHCCRTVVPHMRERGYGRIVTVASIAGKEGNPNICAYSASKAGVIGFCKGLAKELFGTGVLVNCITPVMVETELFEQMTQEHIDYCRTLIPMGRFLQIEEVAAMAAWIAGPECSFTTGAVFDLSGGRATY